LLQCDFFGEGSGVTRLNCRAIGDRIGKGKADLDQIRAGFFQGEEAQRRRLKIGIAGGDERHQRDLPPCFELGESLTNRFAGRTTLNHA
jgi:hypothetical protein